MCRWITLLSSEQVPLSDIVTSPSNSLIQLSKDASFHPGYTEMNNHRMNGDGFGVGWYHSICPPEHRQNELCTRDASEHMSAAVFKDTQPAWNNANLRELSKAIQSHCIVAHVRAASPFAGITEPNCHPFKAGRLLFCHNGRIPRFNKIRRQVLNEVSEEAYVAVRGTTDSEAIFALILTYLGQDTEFGSPFQQTKPFGHKRLTAAVKRALRSIERILEDSADYDNNFSTLNFCLTDGETVVVTRFCDKSPQVPPPSLYFAFGDAKALENELINEEADPVFNEKDDSKKDDPDSDSGSGNGSNEDEEGLGSPVDLVFKVSAPGKIYADIDRNSASFIVSSCPLTRTHTWNPMPKNSIMWYTRGSFPELRMLKRRKKSRSLVMMPPPTPAEADITPDGLFQVMQALKQHL